MTQDNDASFDFASLSLRDRIEARDLYHFHLMSKANVIGTAAGLYRNICGTRSMRKPGR